MKNKTLIISIVAILVICLTMLTGCANTEVNTQNSENENVQNTQENTEDEKIETTTGQINSEYYGDYINYGIDLNGDANTSNDWKIFYDDGTYTYIIANSSILLNEVPDISSMKKLTNNSNYLAYFEHSYLVNEMKELQGNSQERFMLGNYELDSNRENSKAVSTLLNTENWKKFVNEYADYAIGGPTLQMWIASWNAKYNDNIQIRTAVDGYEVKLNEESEWTSIVDMKDKQGYTDELYFPIFTDLSGTSRCNYWLASPGHLEGTSNTCVYQITDDEAQSIYGTYYGMGGGFRPIISLKADQKLIKENGIWNISK